MKQISDFLKLFNSIENPKDQRVSISNVMSKSVGFKVDESLIKLKNGCILVKVNQARKNFIYNKKDDILNDLNKAFPELYINKILFV